MTTLRNDAAQHSVFSLARQCSWVVVFMGWLCCPAPAAAQISREAELKVAYLYNIARYTEYPASAFANPQAPFVIGVVGSSALDDHLKTLARTKTLNNRPIVIQRFDKVENITPCHMLFIPERLDDVTETKAAEKFAAEPVSVVGEGDAFLAKGGGISFVVVDNRIKPYISLKKAQRGGLKLSSKLLQVSVVID